MDKIMKVLQELERNARAEMERQVEASRPQAPGGSPQAQRKRKKQQKQQQAQGRLEAPDESLTPVAPIPTSAPPQVHQEAPRASWDRKRIVDALTLMTALGPPPGLSDDW